MAHGPRFTAYDDAISTSSTMIETPIKSKKRDAQAMDSNSSSSRKRQRTGRGFMAMEAATTVQKKVFTGSGAEELYLDVRDGARTPLDDAMDFGLDALGNEYGRVKRPTLMPKPVSSIGSNRSSSNSLAAKVLRKMANKYATPSTPPARIGRLEYQSTQSLVDKLPLRKVNATSVRAYGLLEHAPHLRKGDTATISKRQPVEHAWSTRRGPSGRFAHRFRQPGSSVHTDDTAVDVKRRTLRKELDGLSKGLSPQSVNSVSTLVVTIWFKAYAPNSLDCSGPSGRFGSCYQLEFNGNITSAVSSVLFLAEGLAECGLGASDI